MLKITPHFRPKSKKLWNRPGVKISSFLLLFYVGFLLFEFFSSFSRPFLDVPKIFTLTFRKSGVNIIDLLQIKSTFDAAARSERVLICVPLRDAGQHISLVFDHLKQLTYPHNLIDLAFLVSDTTDDTLPKLHSNLEEIQSSKDVAMHFNDVMVIEKDFGQSIDQSFSDRHDFSAQGSRRKLMAKARNWLLTASLKPQHSWVYWRDADIEISPGTILEDLMKHDKDVIVPNVWRPLPDWLGREQPYDLNSWQESRAALELAKTLDEDEVIVEGYAEYTTWRPHLAYLRDPYGNKDALIPLDGIGGVSLLVKAAVFRHGAIFPAFAFENHAETEGFGKMCRKMGFSVYGLPHYVIWHIYEPSLDDLKYMAEQERSRLEAEHEEMLQKSREIEGRKAQKQWEKDLLAIEQIEK